MSVMKFYDGIIRCLVFLGAVCVSFITLAIIVDVAMRNLGFHSIQGTSSLIEYGLLFMTIAVAPYLVRNNGHVAIESFVQTMPQSMQVAVSLVAMVMSTLVLGLVSWRAAAVAVDVARSGAVDMRSINFPGWVLYAMLSVGFGLMAVEFLIMVLRGERYRGSQGEG